MSLAHALLTALLEKPTTGYELARRFDKSIGFFWHATHQQIYRELARMEAAGWIDSYVPEDAGRTRKKAHQVLPAGRDELVRWTREEAAPRAPRDAFALKLRADAVLGESDLREEVRRHVAMHTERLAQYRGFEVRDYPPGRPLTPRQAIQRAILRKGILYEESEITWGREMLEVLDSALAAR